MGQGDGTRVGQGDGSLVTFPLRGQSSRFIIKKGDALCQDNGTRGRFSCPVDP